MASFDELVVPHADFVRRLAMKLTRGADHGKDVAQNALVRAFRLWHTYVPESPVRPWLTRITVREFLRDKRYKQPRAKAMARVTDVIAELYLHGSEHAPVRSQPVPGMNSGNSDDNDRREAIERHGLGYAKKYLEDDLTARAKTSIYNSLATWVEPPELDGGVSAEMKIALARLRPEQREVITLFAEAGPSYDDLAEELGIDRETFKSRLRHARDRLRADPALVALVAGFRCRAGNRIRSSKPVERAVPIVADVHEGHAGAAHLDERPADPAAAGPGGAHELGVSHGTLRESAGDRGDEIGRGSVVPDVPRAAGFELVRGETGSLGSASGDVARAPGAYIRELLLEG